jgi:hypothetical protein
MLTFIKQNRLLAVVVALFVFAILYYAFFMNKGSSVALLSSGGGLGNTSPQSQQLLVVLANLRTIQLNDAVFKDPVFLSLNDFGVVITPENAGRRNPFLPFAPDVQPPTPTAATQQPIVVPLAGRKAIIKPTR